MHSVGDESGSLGQIASPQVGEQQVPSALLAYLEFDLLGPGFVVWSRRQLHHRILLHDSKTFSVQTLQHLLMRYRFAVAHPVRELRLDKERIILGEGIEAYLQRCTFVQQPLADWWVVDPNVEAQRRFVAFEVVVQDDPDRLGFFPDSSAQSRAQAGFSVPLEGKSALGLQNHPFCAHGEKRLRGFTR